ncbi:MAG: sigma-70 family RNA polymerase sigma factor [Desulfotalea sp.]
MQQQVMDHWDMINRLALKRFKRDETAEEAALYVLERLAMNDWKRLHQFEGKAKFSTFLSSVTYRLLEDYSRKKFGRVVPPKWIRELGGIWLTLFRLLCLERFSFHEAIGKSQNVRHDLSEEQIESSAEHLLSEVTDCGKSFQEEEYDDEKMPDNKAQSILSAEQKEGKLISQAVSREIFGELQNDENKKVITKLLGQHLDLDTKEQLLLKLRFREGLAIAEIGKMFGLNRFQINGRLRRTLEKVKKQFIRAGCEEELKLLLL